MQVVGIELLFIIAPDGQTVRSLTSVSKLNTATKLGLKLDVSDIDLKYDTSVLHKDPNVLPLESTA